MNEAHTSYMALHAPVRRGKVMEVVEHTKAFGPDGRAAFMQEWYRLTGWTVPHAESVPNYWHRHGGWMTQAG